ncbi:MAG TPA: BRO family protein, partial [Candidatus Paceibacterota bacterium]|nr:BRO family protein [Candidatus Paceibacterota bacterium]
MSNELIPFEYNGNSIRVVQIDGEPWWVAKDVCDVLGFENPSDATKYLESD